MPTPSLPVRGQRATAVKVMRIGLLKRSLPGRLDGLLPRKQEAHQKKRFCRIAERLMLGGGNATTARNEFSGGTKPMAYKIMIMGASYGSLLASKVLFGGHSVHLICLPAEADLINSEGFRVRMPIRGRKDPIEIDSRKLPGKE